MEKITIACPKCMVTGEVPEAHVGKSVTCSKCGEKFKIKYPDAGFEIVEPDTATPEPTPLKPVSAPLPSQITEVKGWEVVCVTRENAIITVNANRKMPGNVTILGFVPNETNKAKRHRELIIVKDDDAYFALMNNKQAEYHARRVYTPYVDRLGEIYSTKLNSPETQKRNETFGCIIGFVVIGLIITLLIYSCSQSSNSSSSNTGNSNTNNQQTTPVPAVPAVPPAVPVNVIVNLPELLGKTSKEIEGILGTPDSKYSVEGGEFHALPLGGTYTEYDTDKIRYIVCLLDKSNRCKSIGVYSYNRGAFTNSEVNTLAEYGIQVPTSPPVEMGIWKRWKQNGNDVEVGKHNDGSIWCIVVIQK